MKKYFLCFMLLIFCKNVSGSFLSKYKHKTKLVERELEDVTLKI